MVGINVDDIPARTGWPKGAGNPYRPISERSVRWSRSIRKTSKRGAFPGKDKRHASRTRGALVDVVADRGQTPAVLLEGRAHESGLNVLVDADREGALGAPEAAVPHARLARH